MRGSGKFCQRGFNSATLTRYFLVDEGKEDPYTTKSGPFKWRFTGGPMMTQH